MGLGLDFPRGRRGEQLNPGGTLSFLPALVSSHALELVGSVPKTATQHSCQQSQLSQTRSQGGIEP